MTELTLSLLEQETPKQKSSADKWIASDMIFVTGGKGYGITNSGDTVCIGDEKDIQFYFSCGVLPDSIWGRGRHLLVEIKEFLKGEENARTNTGESFRAIKARNQRSRPAKQSKRRAAGIKSTSFRKRLSGSKT